MHFRKCFGYAVYPLLAATLFAPQALRAQSTTPAQPADSQAQQSAPPPAPPANMQEPVSQEQQRALVLREAQARVNARRRARIRLIVKDTYSHKYDVYFGGGYLRFRPGATLQHMNESAWDIGFVDYFHGRLGAAIDTRGYYGTAYTGRHPSGINEVYNPSISQYTFLAGPQYRFYEGQHWGWTAQVLAGAGHGNFATGTGGLAPGYVGLYNDGTVLNVDPGVSVDYNLGPALAIRLTPNALFTHYNGDFQRNLGWNIGVLYRFGRQ